MPQTATCVYFPIYYSLAILSFDGIAAKWGNSNHWVILIAAFSRKSAEPDKLHLCRAVEAKFIDIYIYIVHAACKDCSSADNYVSYVIVNQTR